MGGEVTLATYPSIFLVCLLGKAFTVLRFISTMDADRIASVLDARIGLRISPAISNRLPQAPIPTTHPREDERADCCWCSIAP